MRGPAVYSIRDPAIYAYVKDQPISRFDARGLAGRVMSGAGFDDIMQKTLPDTLCAIVPAICTAKVIRCTEATCMYSDSNGCPYVVEGITFSPPPNAPEMAKEFPNCTCTKSRAFDDD